MKNFLPIFLCLTYSASVRSLQCYSCDSTDLEYDQYEDCDTHYKFTSEKEDCEIDYNEFEDPKKIYVCYRTVFFHKDDGYVIMRGCEVEGICGSLKNSTKYLGNRPMAIPIECQVCRDDFCDPRDSDQDSEDNWINEQCHDLEPDYDTCEWEIFPTTDLDSSTSTFTDFESSSHSIVKVT